MKATMKFELPNKENYFLENIFQESSELMDGQETNSVTRFGEVPPLWQIFKNLWQYI